ncbi:hypothetical protein A2686_03885 [Candidatus Woesebacteria bacterium RIFCSPHIGHO2_01_FULL_38_10]|uniref:Four helix bundle protein n=1 Tax=Candidatus Woesebacteria bacterium RIFCSPLOWO2_01_FULL_39_10b TaxID=1802517 RepID=A0A1F8B9G8_9BACT|nr:MAG: hypothetical protein A2686_03885 [Candidatus Woesebacteria bacterium RIFCSPHIGHO2_01_FULL_38_10]OGM59988.1 MAG: hypothetical protein A2892_03765 [Candidatus Woesebacteria bacterium RIFCSPLOWO2_01_FULL_39_10b]
MSNSEDTKSYLSLEKLDAYKKARELSKIVWKIYNKLIWEDKKIGGYQFIQSTDSVAANVAEGYGRFHYLDKAKFYSNFANTSRLAARMKRSSEQTLPKEYFAACCEVVYYNARGSLLESLHWLELLDERGKIDKKDKSDYLQCYKSLRPLLNGLIRSVIKQKSS